MWRTDSVTGKKYRDLGDGLIMYQGFEKFLKGLGYAAYGAAALMVIGVNAAIVTSEHPAFVLVF